MTATSEIVTLIASAQRGLIRSFHNLVPGGPYDTAVPKTDHAQGAQEPRPQDWQTGSANCLFSGFYV